LSLPVGVRRSARQLTAESREVYGGQPGAERQTAGKVVSYWQQETEQWAGDGVFMGRRKTTHITKKLCNYLVITKSLCIFAP